MQTLHYRCLNPSLSIHVPLIKKKQTSRSWAAYALRSCYKQLSANSGHCLCDSIQSKAALK